MNRPISIVLAAFILITVTLAIPGSRMEPARAAEGSFSWGMNLMGLCGAYTSFATIGHGEYGRHYTSPTTEELDYFKSRGITLFRLTFRWERAQHSLFADLDPEDIAYIDSLVDAADERGLAICLDPHNFGRYFDFATGQEFVIGDPNCPNSAFADFWARMATHFRGRVWAYDLMNEPHDMASQEAWVEAAQAAINAIREVDTNTTIVVGGYAYSSSRTWPVNSDGLKDLVDPGDNLVYDAHCYYDSDGSGKYPEPDIPAQALYPTSSTRGWHRLSPFVDWLRANGKKGLIGETGVPPSDFWVHSVFRPALDYLVANQDVLVSVILFASGRSWPDTHPLKLDPTRDASGTYVDKPQISLLADCDRPAAEPGTVSDNTTTTSALIGLLCTAGYWIVRQGIRRTRSPREANDGAPAGTDRIL